MGKNEQLESALERLYSFIDYEKLGNKNPYGTSESDIARFRELLHSRGDRHKAFLTVLVAGSKGKGSVCAMLESIFRAAGMRTGLYTSPHLVDIRERFTINGACVPADLLADKFSDLTEAAVNDHAERGFRTVFEILTASAFEIFAEAKIDIGIIEVGMGGRLDATNAIDPNITVITAIGLDHTHVLGDTVEAIAREKAGILRPGVPLILGKQCENARRTILEAAKTAGALPVIDLNENLSLNNAVLTELSTSFDYSFGVVFLPDVRIPLLGGHQAENAAVAITVAKQLNIDNASIYHGLEAVRWPGRMQLIASRPDILVDGAHSPMAFERLIEAIRQIWQTPPVWVFAVNKDKDFPSMLNVVKKYSRGIIFTTFDWPRAASVNELKAVEPSGIAAGDLIEAVNIARTEAGSNGLVVIAGSLYLAGLTLKEYGLYPCGD